MPNKSDIKYINYIDELIELLSASNNDLIEYLSNYQYEKLNTYLTNIDNQLITINEKKDEILKNLKKSFLTFINKEDIILIINNLILLLENNKIILTKLLIYGIRKIDKNLNKFLLSNIELMNLLSELIKEFNTSIRSKDLDKIINIINSKNKMIENNYLNIVINLRKQYYDILDIIAWLNIYETIYNKATAIINFTNIINIIIIKNN